MNASYEWLRAFVDFDLSPRELADLLTRRCATVDGIVPLREDLRDIVIARVVEAARHPNSDHLWVTKVDAGGEILDVVCGAPVVTAGTLYPFAGVGSTLPGGLKIEKRKIRGETSNGMLCSARELLLGSDHAGIMALDIEAKPGTPFLDAMKVGDSRIIIDVLPNRPDLLSHEGLAREIAAALGKTCKDPEDPGSFGCESRVIRLRPREARSESGNDQRSPRRHRRLPALCGRSDPRRENRAEPRVAGPASRRRRNPLHQQRRRRHQLHAPRLRPADARVRCGASRRERGGNSQLHGERADHHSRRNRS